MATQFISLFLVFVGMAALVLIPVCIVRRALRRGNEGRNEEESDNGNDRRIGRNTSSREELENLPCFEYKEAENRGVSGAGDCAVCLESFKVGDMCRSLPNCLHSFHVWCIDSWILKTPICPIC